VDVGNLNESLRQLGEQRGHPLRGSLQAVVDACVQVFTVTGSGLMIADDQSVLRYAVATDGPGRVLEEVQLDTGEGPCIEAFVTDELVVSEDLAVDGRWPRVAERVGPLGVHGMLGLPVHLGGIAVGSLDVYVNAPHNWDLAEERALTRYSDVVAALTEAALAAQQAGELADQLNYALDHRVPIERGIGYLMARDRLDHAAAFNRLRRASRNTRRRIGEVAEELLRTGQLPDEEH
jgi:GAF domain-containing protein